MSGGKSKKVALLSKNILIYFILIVNLINECISYSGGIIYIFAEIKGWLVRIHHVMNIN